MDAILSGCDTREKVNKKTGSGSGGCNATRCGPVIEQLLENHRKKCEEEMAGQEGLEPPTS
jgi:NAD(P)H-nitrite reductase large subunit